MRSWSSFEIGALLLALLVGLAAGFALTLDSLQAAPAAATKTIGSVIYKLRTAETRHNDQAVWSVLPQNSPVFELDTVRTASESAADVVLGKTTKVALGPDTMIRLELGGQALNVVRGTVRLKSKAGQAITVKTNAAAVTVSQGEAILSTDGTKTTTTVVEGTASMVSQGASQELSAGKSAAVDAGGVAAAVTVQPESPTAGEVIWTDQKTAAIDLRWTAPDGWQGRLMIGPTKDLKKPVVEQTVSGGLLQTTLAPGVWWWSLGDSTVPAQRFEVKPLPVPQLIRPASGAVAASADNPELDVRWTPVTGASEYRVEVFAQADLKTPEVSQTTGGTSLQLNVVSTGDHLVRVVAVFETLGLESITLARPFTVGTSLKVPLQWRNSTGEALQLNRAQVGGEAGALHWQADPGSRFRVRVGADQAMTKIVSDRVVQGDTYRLEDSLPEGTYYVEISRQESGARLASSSDLIRRTVVYTKPSPPVAVSPGQGLLVAPEAGQLTLSYEDPNDSPRIQVEVAADPAFSGALAKARGGAGKAVVTLPQKTPQTLYWRVEILDDKEGVLVASSPQSFRVPLVLDAPQLLSPAPGSRIDLFTSAAVTFHWLPVDRASAYSLTLFRTIAGLPTKVRSWETADTTLVWKDFSQLTTDTYTVDLQAVRAEGKAVVGQSPVVKSAFRLEQSSKVKAVNLDLNLSVESD